MTLGPAGEDKEVAEVLLDCIYGATAYNDKNRGGGELSQLEFDLLVYVAADFVDFPKLATLAAQKFGHACHSAICDPAGGIDFWLAIVQKVYEETQTKDKILRPLVASMCVYYRPRLVQHKDFEMLLRSDADLGADLFLAAGTGNAYFSATPSQFPQPSHFLESSNDSLP